MTTRSSSSGTVCCSTCWPPAWKDCRWNPCIRRILRPCWSTTASGIQTMRTRWTIYLKKRPEYHQDGGNAVHPPQQPAQAAGAYLPVDWRRHEGSGYAALLPALFQPAGGRQAAERTITQENPAQQPPGSLFRLPGAVFARRTAAGSRQQRLPGRREGLPEEADASIL